MPRETIHHQNGWKNTAFTAKSGEHVRLGLGWSSRLGVVHGFTQYVEEAPRSFLVHVIFKYVLQRATSMGAGDQEQAWQQCNVISKRLHPGSEMLPLSLHHP